MVVYISHSECVLGSFRDTILLAQEKHVIHVYRRGASICHVFYNRKWPYIFNALCNLLIIIFCLFWPTTCSYLSSHIGVIVHAWIVMYELLHMHSGVWTAYLNKCAWLWFCCRELLSCGVTVLHGCKLLCLLWICILDSWLFSGSTSSWRHHNLAMKPEFRDGWWQLSVTVGKLGPFDLEVESMGAYLEYWSSSSRLTISRMNLR